MRMRGWMVALPFLGALASVAVAQSSLDPLANEQYVPRLGDIMNAVQSRHMKLWFAGKAQNRELAAYELRQLRAGLAEAASLYSGIPVSNVTTMVAPLQSIADAIEAKDSGRFSKAYGQLRAGCNGCHQSMGRGYIVIRTPDASPFGDQVFTPQRQ